jgi:hypothetical protein
MAAKRHQVILNIQVTWTLPTKFHEVVLLNFRMQFCHVDQPLSKHQ